MKYSTMKKLIECKKIRPNVFFIWKKFHNKGTFDVLVISLFTQEDANISPLFIELAITHIVTLCVMSSKGDYFGNTQNNSTMHDEFDSIVLVFSVYFQSFTFGNLLLLSSYKFPTPHWLPWSTYRWVSKCSFISETLLKVARVTSKC